MKRCILLTFALGISLLAAAVLTALPTTTHAFSDEDDNRETILRIVNEGFNQGNVAVIDEVVAPDYVSYDPSGATEDRDAFKASILAFRAAMPDLNARADPIIAEDNWVAFRFTMTGTFQNTLDMGDGAIPPTGETVTFHSNIIARFNEAGLLVEEWDEFDFATFGAQLGLMDEGMTDDTGGEMMPTEAAMDGPDTGAGLDGNALVNERCTVCHSRDRIDAQDKDEAGWTATVDRMIGYGAQLNADERAAVIQYLVETH